MSVGYNRHRFDKSISARVSHLLRTDNYHSLGAILLNYAIVVITILLTINTNYWLYPLALLVIGSRQRALGSILHDASHKVAAKNKYLNFILATFCSGYLIFSTFSSYRYTHLKRHHRHFGDPEKDDDYKYMLQKGVYDISSWRNYFQRIFVCPFMFITVPSHIVLGIKSRCLNNDDNKNRLEILLLCLYWLILIAVILHFELLQIFILFWVIPFLTTFQLINWFIELSEHAPLMENSIDIEMSRNRNSHWLERIFTGMHNESYHLAHHLWPSVPFWNVKKLHELLLQDKDYASINQKFGGIFFSSNFAEPLCKVLNDYYKQEKIMRESNEVK